MADPSRRLQGGALGVVGAVTLGAMTAAFVTPPALADEPDYPSWGDVQRAKADQAAAGREAQRITGLLGDLQDRADAAGRTAAIAAERFHRAKLAENAARDRHAALAVEADRASSTARTSRMRAGLLAASVARGSSGGELQVFLDPGHADDFLSRLASISQLSAQTQSILQGALADERQASALGAQADVAATVLTQRAEAAQEALGAAQRAVSSATEAVTTEQRHADRLVAQLAALRGTSTRVAAQYAAGVRAEQSRGGGSATGSGGAPATGAAAGAAPGGAASSAPAATAPAATAPAATAPSSAAPDPGPSAAPEPVEPDPVAATPTTAGPPNSAQAASAVAYARDQIGDAYRFGGAGPSSWDCSGLTMQAYASVGIGIGGHSATAQYRLAKAQGQLVPYSQAQVGDLVFYTDGGGDMYHVAIYSGVGMMIEAPYPGVPVREVAVRSADRVAQLARPTASAS